MPDLWSSIELREKKDSLFDFEEYENQTFNMPKKMKIMDRDWIIGSEGIPFNYIVNLRTEVEEIILFY